MFARRYPRLCPQCADSSSASLVVRAAIAAALAVGIPTAFAKEYIETFACAADPAPLSAADWMLISGTNNPTTVGADFSANNNENIIKLTSVNDQGAQFTSAHLFSEHDYWTGATGDGGADPNNFGRGDLLVYTTKPIDRYSASAINLNGAYISVDYANGNAFNGGPFFYFAFRIAGGRWFVYETVELGLTTASVTRATMSTDPLDETFTFIPLLINQSGFNPDIRLIPDDSNARELTADELATVTAVGLYIYPSYDTGPSRFDNYTITNFTVVPGAAQPGDLDGDGDVDLDDYGVLANCLAGPDIDAPAGCTLTDLDTDGDVDMLDLAILQAAFTG